MRTINKVTILGYVGQEPVVRSVSSGVVASFSVATSYRTKEKKEVTEWHRLTAWGRTAEIVRDYVSKGSALYVEGELKTRSWEQDGVTRYSTEVVVRELSMLNSKTADSSKRAALNAAANTEITDDDIPF